MSLFFEQLNPSEKNSVHQSMNSIIRSFMNDVVIQDSFTTKDLFWVESDFIDELYFLWFQHSAYREYRWTNSFSMLYFSNDFSNEMKQLLKFHLYRYVKSMEEQLPIVCQKEKQELMVV